MKPLSESQQKKLTSVDIQKEYSNLCLQLGDLHSKKLLLNERIKTLEQSMIKLDALLNQVLVDEQKEKELEAMVQRKLEQANNELFTESLVHLSEEFGNK